MLVSVVLHLRIIWHGEARLRTSSRTLGSTSRLGLSASLQRSVPKVSAYELLAASITLTDFKPSTRRFAPTLPSRVSPGGTYKLCASPERHAPVRSCAVPSLCLRSQLASSPVSWPIDIRAEALSLSRPSDRALPTRNAESITRTLREGDDALLSSPVSLS